MLNREYPELQYIFNGNHAKGEIAIFCGAGISKNSGLPLVKELKKEILESLKTESEDIEEILNSIIPFEAFMEPISVNSDISIILQLFRDGEPNTNHMLIAKLAKKGIVKTIVTTNFDSLIEKALKMEGLAENKDYKVYFIEKEFENLNLNNLDDNTCVFKIHGSAHNTNSIRSTVKEVFNTSLSTKRDKIIKHLFQTGEHKKSVNPWI